MSGVVGRTIQVRCQGARIYDLDDLLEFQGELKSLSTQDYMKLRGQILKHGICDAFNVWDHEGRSFILDGHQRKRVLVMMRDQEGYEVPPLPGVPVHAGSKREAKQILLGLASNYGKVEGQGLYEFAFEAGITIDELDDAVRFPDIHMEMFRQEFFADTVPPREGDEKDGATEYGQEEFSQFGNRCPRCGFEYGKPGKDRGPSAEDRAVEAVGPGDDPA